MIIIGLTGSIGMGKSTLAKQCKLLGAHSCNADDIVHMLLAPHGPAVELVGKYFPEAVSNHTVDRAKLGAIVFADDEKRELLESIIHPMVFAYEDTFIDRCRLLGVKIVVLDIPLLFETDGEERCHYTMVATAPQLIQRQRVLKRPRMSEQKFRRILSHQLPDRIKRQLADFVVHTGLGKAYSMRQLKKILSEIQHA